MEKDNLKKYIQQHRADFDDMSVPQNILPDLMKRMGKRKSRRRIVLYYFAAAACLAGLVIFSYQSLFHRRDTNEINHIVAEHEKKAVEINPSEMNPETRKERPVAPVVFGKENITPKKYDPYRKIYNGLQDGHSVARRMEAIMTINEKTMINRKLKDTLFYVLNTDENSNVRLAALNVLLKYAADSLVEKHLIHALGNQTDPVIQMELIRVIENNTNPAATKKLIEIADDPYTIPPVREQVFYALMNRQ